MQKSFDLRMKSLTFKSDIRQVPKIELPTNDNEGRKGRIIPANLLKMMNIELEGMEKECKSNSE